ncbi:MAG: tRNA uridine-5-carboxymethylaminomethyl(34) synthesis enzyme MnmG [Clostridiaceae bacterium]|nr:tRNA uridine-5-carboxymethylaminomethyl(34) synthesis enzyme MnmG [Clostridiaceae bacterium]
MDYLAGSYDIVVVGAGHAGIEAALAAGRMGCSVLCLCTNLDAVGNMPCNPSIGGTAKGQLVREIDALGGEMARAADASCLQFRMLNRGKGPAVFSPREQNDRMAYRAYMRRVLEVVPGLFLRQGECAEILTENGAVSGIRMAGGARYAAKAAVLCTGTFLGGKTFTGEDVREMGPDGMYAAMALTPCLQALGLQVRRFKTGTPARVDGRTVDFSVMEPQEGEPENEGFSFGSLPPRNIARCWLTYTNERTHEIIRASLDRSPLFTGVIHGVGPRYCPSIEDKVVRFSDKPRHQLFLEPCGEHTMEYYVQGMSSSLPEEVQVNFLRTVRGLEQVRIMRPGYAIEYDCIDPLELRHTLEARHVPGLYFAGQICGSSGYEEAAGQGLVAGINAALSVQGRSPFTLRRSDGYIGTLIDDLVTRGTNEPYRMMTSRSEYRLLSRQDNADRRLMPMGHALGLISDARLAAMEAAYAAAEGEISRLRETYLAPDTRLCALLETLGTAPPPSGVSLLELLRRPEVRYADLAPVDEARPCLSAKVIEQVEIEIKYEGYIRRQLQDIRAQARLEDRYLPEEIDYLSIPTLRTEARQKLQRVRPETLGQASRISGVSPADIGALTVWLSHSGRAALHESGDTPPAGAGEHSSGCTE